MALYTAQDLAARIYKSKIQVFTINTLRSVLGIANEQTFYSVLKKMVHAEILEKIEAGKYIMTDNPPRDFLIANFIYQPSYVSFETALNYYGILSQFPYETTSATTRKSQTKILRDKAYSYVHLKKELFWGYEKLDGNLIAVPEKALLDQIYLASKGLRSSQFDEYDLTVINKKLFWEYIAKYKKLKKYARNKLNI